MSSMSIWAPVIAAVGASGLTGFVTFWISWRQRCHDKQVAAQQAKATAYGALLGHSFQVGTRIEAIGQLRRLRSGISEGLDVTLRRRKPLDLLELHDWLSQDFGPLADAWSRIWVVGTQEAVDVSDRLMQACSDLMGATTTPGPNGNQLRRTFQGERWTSDQQQAFMAAQQQFSVERVAFAALARRELGAQAVTFALERRGSSKELVRSEPGEESTS